MKVITVKEHLKNPTRVFTELSPERDYIAQMFGSGLEKKEIARITFKAVSTVNNTLQKVFEQLSVRNGRELAIKLAERLSGMKITFDFSPEFRSAVACCLLFVFMLSLYEGHDNCRRGRRTKIEERTEYVRRCD